jgi:hypothetical protein
MNGEAPELVSHDFALSRMETCAQSDTKRGSGFAYGAGASNRPRGPVERAKEPITRGVDLAAPEAGKLASDAALMGLQ